METTKWFQNLKTFDFRKNPNRSYSESEAAQLLAESFVIPCEQLQGGIGGCHHFMSFPLSVFFKQWFSLEDLEETLVFYEAMQLQKKHF